MAIAFVQLAENFSTGSATSLAGDFGTTPVNGNLIVVASRVSATGRTVTVTDDGTNTYTQARSQVQTTSAYELFVHYAMNITGVAAHTVTVAISGAAAGITFTLHEYSGAAIQSALDQVNSGQLDTSTALDSGNVTINTSNQLIFGAGAASGGRTFTLGTNFSNLASSPSAAGTQRQAGEDRIVSTTGTYSATFSLNTTANWACIVATFREAGWGQLIAGYRNRLLVRL